MNKIWILLVFLLPACIYEWGDARLKIINRTNHEISFDYNIDTVPKYPSTKRDRPITYIGDTSHVPENRDNWPAAIERSNNKKLNLFIYNVDSLKKYNEIDLLIQKGIYKRFSYSREELEKSNWIVTIKD